MTKRTEKLILSVFEYCLRAAYIAMTEGILALEYLRLEKGLTDTAAIVAFAIISRADVNR